MPTTPPAPMSRIRRIDLSMRLHEAYAPLRDAFGQPEQETRAIAHAVYIECERIEREYGGAREECIAYWKRQQAATAPQEVTS